MDPLNDSETSHQGTTPPRRPRAPLPTTPTLPPRAELLPIVNNDEAYHAFKSVLGLVELNCGVREANRFSEALSNVDLPEGSLGIDKIAHAFERVLRKCLRARNEEVSETITTATESALRAALQHQQNTAQSAQPRTATPGDIHNLRRVVSDRLPPLIRGISAMNWSRHVRDVLARDGANLTEDVKLDLVKKAAYLHKEVATLLDAHLAGKTLVTVTDFLHEVQQHFKPDPIGYIECIRAKAQKDNQTASSYVKELEDIGLSFWIGYPTSEEQFDVIINTFSKHHYTYIRQQFDVARSTVRRTAGANSITFRGLITWANSSDSAFTTNKMQKNYDRGAGKAAGAQGQNQPGHDNQGKGRRGRKNKDKGQANLGQAANEQGFEEYKSFVCQLDIDCSSEDIEMDCALSELANQHKVQSPSVQVRTPSRADQNVVGFREVIPVSRANAPYTPIPKLRARSRVHATLDDAMQEPQVPLVHSTAVHVPIDQDGFIVVNNSKRKRLAVPPLPVSNAKSPSSKALPPSSPHVFPVTPVACVNPQSPLRTPLGTTPLHRIAPQVGSSIRPRREACKPSAPAVASSQVRVAHSRAFSPSVSAPMAYRPPGYSQEAPPNQSAIAAAGQSLHHVQPISNFNSTPANAAALHEHARQPPRAPRDPRPRPQLAASIAQQQPAVTVEPPVASTPFVAARRAVSTSAAAPDAPMQASPLLSTPLGRADVNPPIDYSNPRYLNVDPTVPPLPYEPSKPKDNRQPHWPRELPDPMEYAGWHCGPHLTPSLVRGENNPPRVSKPFVPVLEHPPNIENEVNMARFNSTLDTKLEPIWKIEKGVFKAASESPLPTHRMLTTMDVVNNKPYVRMVSPQVQLAGDNLVITTLTQGPGQMRPELSAYTVDISDLLNRRPQEPVSSTVGAGDVSTPLESMFREARTAQRNRANRYYDLSFQARAEDAELYSFQKFKKGECNSLLLPIPPPMEPHPQVNIPPPMPPADSSDISINMMQALGPMSGTPSPEEVQANAAGNRRPYNAEPYRRDDRNPHPVAPAPYFNSPEHRLGQCMLTISLAGLAQLNRNPDYAPFIDSLEKLVRPMNKDLQPVVSQLAQCINNMALEQNLPLRCVVPDQDQAQGGGAPAFVSNFDAGPSATILVGDVHEIPICTLLTPAMQLAEPLPLEQQIPYLQAALMRAEIFNMPTASMPSFEFSHMDKTDTSESPMRIIFECLWSDPEYQHRLPATLWTFDEAQQLIRSSKCDSALLPFSLLYRDQTASLGNSTY
eukprot:jgi/Botrbrau1/20385/Bobra.0006s0046.1